MKNIKLVDGLLAFKKNIFSQNGEDGIIEELFRRIKFENQTCCEFGAWDGNHLSNCRRLILDGWKALMIEGDRERFNDLEKTYEGNRKVVCVNRFVDVGVNRLQTICIEYKFEHIDFLSIDIDGLDYQILEDMDMRPRVVCVEVNAGHDPESDDAINIDIAKNNVGQPFGVFSKWAIKNDYRLVCYTGNAFYVRGDIVDNCREISSISNSVAYIEYLSYLPKEGKQWMWMVNLGLVGPFFKFRNKFLKRNKLELSMFDCLQILQKIRSKIGNFEMFLLISKSIFLGIIGKRGSLKRVA